MKVDWLIVGAGFTGVTMAERIASLLGQKVLLVERRDHVGGNAYDYYDENGILVHYYGPHIFHTNNQQVWEYLSQFTEWRPYFHRVLGVVDGQKVPIPFNLNSLNIVFPPKYAEKLEEILLKEFGFGVKVPILKLRESTNKELRHLADYIYHKVFYGYTYKQWGMEPELLDPSVTARVPVYISRDNRYFQDFYQALPKHGYSSLFRRMLANTNIKLLLNTDYKEIKNEIRYDRMVFTGPIDEFFEYIHGALPYRTTRIKYVTHDGEYSQEVGTVNYPNEYDFTRVTEMKHLTGQQISKTTLIYEYPESYIPGNNEPYYPVPEPRNLECYEKYQKEVRALNGKVLFAGRLAEYRYYNMDQAVARALELFEKEITN